MASAGRKQRKKTDTLQDEAYMSAQRVTSTENCSPHGTTSRTQVGRRIHTGDKHKEVVCTDTRSQQRHENMPRVENELLGGGLEHENEEGSRSEGESEEKILRGPTYMKDIWGRPPNLQPLMVEYNEFGQPIGGENSKLCHFLGSLARNGKYCPLDFNNWHAMPKEKKRDMMEVVKSRFYVPINAEKWILTSIGHKWRNWKHSLKTKYWLDIPIEHLIDERDDRVAEDQWIKLLLYWRTEEAKKTSQRNKTAREKKIMDQRTGKTSFAQVQNRLMKEQGRRPTRVELFNSCFISSTGNSSAVVSSKYSAMQERRNQLLDDSEDTIAPNDIFAQIIGKEKPGHVRMMGHGICPSDVWSDNPRSTSSRLLMEYKAKVAQLEAELSTQQRSPTLQVNTREGATSVNSLSTHARETFDKFQVGTHVSLRSVFTQKIVAKGYIHSMDPSRKVGGQMLGLNWCEVNVTTIVEPKEQLIRPYNNFQEFSQMLDEMIAWPCSLVAPSET